jgi:ATP-binding cassette subfamily B protein
VSARIDPDARRHWLRRLWPLLRRHRRVATAGLAAALVVQFLQVAAPRVLMAAIDRALVAREAPLGTFVAVIALLGLARLGAGVVFRSRLYQTGALLQYDLRTLLQHHLGRQSHAYFDRVHTGQLISRANADIRAIEMFLTFGPAIVVMVVGALVGIGLMLRISVPLTVASLAPLPLVAVGGVRMRRALFPIAWIVQARTGDLATIIEENIAGAHVVRGFAAEPLQVRRLAAAARRLRWAATREVELRGAFQPLLENLPRLSLVIVLGYGGWLAARGVITVGALVAFSAYVALLQHPFRVMGFFVMLAQRAAASALRVFEIVDATPPIADRPGGVDLVDPVGDVVFEGVRFGYDGREEVLRGVDLRIRPGETVALVGRTGSGKSTLARLLPRFYDVDAGAVRIDGHDVRDLTLDSLHAAVGVVPDEAFLFSASLRDNIAYARPDANQSDVEAAAAAAGAAEFIARLPDGYDTVVGERGYTLSGGQRQRIAIARALLANPRVLVLDDATSAVDVEVERTIHAALQDLLAHRTTLVVAHRLSTIALADRVVLLEDGRVVAEGTHRELLASSAAYVEVLAQAGEGERERESAA